MEKEIKLPPRLQLFIDLLRFHGLQVEIEHNPVALGVTLTIGTGKYNGDTAMLFIWDMKTLDAALPSMAAWDGEAARSHTLDKM